MAKIFKLTGIRGFVARKMRESLAKTAQLTFHGELDASQMVAARALFKEQGLPASYEDMIIMTLAQSVTEFPLFNSCLTQAGLELSEQININIAIDTDVGLMAPALFDVTSLNLQEIARLRKDLIGRAGRNKLTVTEQSGGTITVSNLGTTRVQYFTPILNYPQIALLGVGTMTRRAVADEQGKIEMRPFIGLSLTVDHAVIDGAPSGKFLTNLCERLERFNYLKEA